jgi:uncharacterized protein YjbI with pentapeptide repeats
MKNQTSFFICLMVMVSSLYECEREGKNVNLSIMASNNQRLGINNVVEDKNSEKSDNKIAFYLYPSRSSWKISYEDFCKMYESGFENKDISDSLWTGDKTYMFDESVFRKGLPVTWQNFYSTKSAKMKVLHYVEIQDHLDMSGFSFRDWTLDYVDFSGAKNINQCNFTDAKIPRCMFIGSTTAYKAETSQDGNMVAGKLVVSSDVELGLTFQQLASTYSYKTNQLDGIILNHINLTHWDFADKDISTMRFPNCLYYNKEENILEEIQKAIDAKIKGEK